MQDPVQHKIFIILLCFFTFPVFAQLSETELSKPDSLLVVAQNHAKSGNYDSCRIICFAVVKKHPHYNDFRVLAGRTLAWEGLSDSAKNVIKPIIEKDPYDKQALLALADVEIWQEKFEQALAYVDTGLIPVPEDIELLGKRAEILHKMQSNIPKTISYGALYPDSNAVGVMYYFEFYKKSYIARRHMISAQYTRITKLAPISARINIGDNVLNNEFLFQNPSYQFEIDAYPRISLQSYLYLNYGVAKGSFFPSHRVGLEYFQGLNKSFEVSAGLRYMYWERSIIFLTGSVSKYIGNYWLSFRPFFTITEKNNSVAYIFEGRRYFGINNSYLFGQIIFGDSPDQPLYLAQEYGNFKSSKYIIGMQHRISDWQINLAIGYQYEEYLNNMFRNKFDFRIGVSYVF